METFVMLFPVFLVVAVILAICTAPRDGEK